MAAFEQESPGIRTSIERYAVGRESLPALEPSAP